MKTFKFLVISCFTSLSLFALPLTATFALGQLTKHQGDVVDLENSFLSMQYDGNLVLYSKAPVEPLWATSTHCSARSNCNYFTRFQYDGNFVAYAPNYVPKWNSATNNKNADNVKIDYQKITINDANNLAVWDSACSDGQIDSSTSCTIPLVDPYFKNINNETTLLHDNDSGTLISTTWRDWRIKTYADKYTNNVVATKVSDGVNLTATFDNTGQLGFLYLRQIIEDVYQFENKNITLVIDYTNNAYVENTIKYDIYVKARFNDNLEDNINIGFLQLTFFPNARHTIQASFEVYDFGGIAAENGEEGLSIAFRIIGENNQNADITIHSIRLIINN